MANDHNDKPCDQIDGVGSLLGSITLVAVILIVVYALIDHLSKG